MFVDPIKFILFVKEAFVDFSCDESLIFEMLDFKKVKKMVQVLCGFYKTSLVNKMKKKACKQVQENSGIIEVAGLQYRDALVIYTIAVGQMTISKDIQGMEAPKSLREAFADSSSDESLIFEMLDFKKRDRR
ncbi:uncharacterized protein LOC110106935 isoform X1 [Dendrobium catenatum]|uniref:uncharacterized protein LOC110106935 isoform X1 n=2 Tax=Dendrobium catenatum TaxID=906689 RepID=UPI0009F3E8E8|nr:uncharacterized protein LOC110106935 isoform X1 [Dendrobium catenatum]XP_028551617.1 uncharacterized protein LOC110106935 isoform X1 [Dendrobium catenatum]